MITLSATTHSIDVTLTAITTSAVEYVVAYADQDTLTFTPAGANAALSGPGPTTLIAGPAASTQRQIKYISAFNADTVANTQTFQFNVAGTRRTLFKATLQPGESVLYMNDLGWAVYNSIGAKKLVAGDVVGPSSATDNAICRFDTTTGKLIQNSAVTVADTTGSIVGPADMTFQGSFIPKVITLAADNASTSTTLANVAGLTFNSLAVGEYVCHFQLYIASAATTTGIKVGVAFSGTATNPVTGWIFPNDTVTSFESTTISTALSSLGTSALQQPSWMMMSCRFIVTVTGNLALQWGTEVAGSSATVRAGSHGILHRVT